MPSLFWRLPSDILKMKVILIWKLLFFFSDWKTTWQGTWNRMGKLSVRTFWNGTGKEERENKTKETKMFILIFKYYQ